MGHFLHEAAEASHSPGLYTLATFVGSFFAADVEKKSIYLFAYHITTKSSQSQLCSASNQAHNTDSYVVQAANTGTRRSGYNGLAPRFIPSSPRLFPLREIAWV